MAETRTSSVKVRALEAKAAASVVKKGCDACKKDAIVLYYTNEGYGEPWWHGYCRDHMEDMRHD